MPRPQGFLDHCIEAFAPLSVVGWSATEGILAGSAPHHLPLGGYSLSLVSCSTEGLVLNLLPSLSSLSSPGEPWRLSRPLPDYRGPSGGFAPLFVDLVDGQSPQEQRASVQRALAERVRLLESHPKLSLLGLQATLGAFDTPTLSPVDPPPWGVLRFSLQAPYPLHHSAAFVRVLRDTPAFTVEGLSYAPAAGTWKLDGAFSAETSAWRANQQAREENARLSEDHKRRAALETRSQAESSGG